MQWLGLCLQAVLQRVGVGKHRAASRGLTPSTIVSTLFPGDVRLGVLLSSLGEGGPGKGTSVLSPSRSPLASIRE